MASNINANNIDGTYPVAGVDNDSQGFRTNFTNIKTNLAYAKTEIEDLQSKVILKSALTGTSLNNSMAGALLSGAEIRDFRETEVDLGSLSGTITLDHSAGSYHAVTSSGSLSLAFSNFPTSSKIGRVRLKIVVTSVSHTLTFPSAVSLGTNSIEGYSANIVTFPAVGTYYFEFITDDAGTTIHVDDLTRPRKPTATSATWGNTTATSYSYFNYSNVSTGFSAAVTSTLLLDSIATLATGTVYFPDTPNNGQVVKIASNNAVTALTMTANTGAILGKATSLSANSYVSYQYVSGPQKWFRIG
jgi:hypothetical protein